MITEPNTEELRKRVNDTYELIVLAAKRAREIHQGSEKLTIFRHQHPLTLAAHEITEGKVYNVAELE